MELLVQQLVHQNPNHNGGPKSRHQDYDYNARSTPAFLESKIVLIVRVLLAFLAPSPAPGISRSSPLSGCLSQRLFYL